MPTWYFTAQERFTPAKGEKWRSYQEFSGFTHIEELISCDSVLCPEVVQELKDDDWSHNVHADFRCYWFLDHEYLRRRVSYESDQHQILAIREKPEVYEPPPEGFEQVGYDILDDFDDISVLTNCGPFPEIFEPTEVNRFGLLDDLAHAHAVAENIRKSHPNDPHCKACNVWQIARYSQEG